MNFLEGQTVGIDLGTCFTGVAQLDASGLPLMQKNTSGQDVTPSVIVLDEDHAIVVGPSAKHISNTSPDKIIEAIKREMGNSDFYVIYENKKLTPEFLSALILKKCLQDTAQRIGPVANAVITVPYYFNDVRRKATADAGRIAGLSVVDIIDEPTASVLAYAWMRGELSGMNIDEYSFDSSWRERDDSKTVLVFDLGGATFDVSVVRYNDSSFQLLATDGDVMLGGLDWTHRLLNHGAEQFQSIYGTDLWEDPETAWTALQEAESTKQDLSTASSAPLTIHHGGNTHSVVVSRANFEQMTADLVNRTWDTTELVLQQANCRVEELHDILLVGGGCFMPVIRKQFTTHWGRNPTCSLDPRFPVTFGAAVHAAILEAKFAGDTRSMVTKAAESRIAPAVAPRRKKTARSPAHGVRLQQELTPLRSPVERIAWSTDGHLLASLSDNRTLSLTDLRGGGKEFEPQHFPGAVIAMTWARRGLLLSQSTGKSISTFRAEDGSVVSTVSNPAAPVNCFAASADMFAAASDAQQIHIWGPGEASVLTLDVGISQIQSLAWNSGGRHLLAGSADGQLIVYEAETGKTFRSRGHWLVADEEAALPVTLPGTPDQTPNSSGNAAWSPTADVFAVLEGNEDISIWNLRKKKRTNVLESHMGMVTDVAFSFDGRLLASAAADSTVRLWRTDTWRPVATIPCSTSRRATFHSLLFHPHDNLLASVSENRAAICIWKIDADMLLQAPAESTESYTSAKLVLIGESNVGKSCLAMRLAEGRYPDDAEHGTTHGMRFWQVDSRHLSPPETTENAEDRDLVIWDMGGQEEYRLVHQLFLHDTSMALVLFDPTRGTATFSEVEAWNKRLDKQLGGRPAVKILVGSKMDDSSSLVDTAAITKLVHRCGFRNYIETSSLTGRGIDELMQLINAALDWKELAVTSRPKLFQQIRTAISRRRQKGHVILLWSKLAGAVRRSSPKSYDAKALHAVTDQLATQGVIASSRLSSRERVLVLQVEQIERYAGSLILAARDNPHGVPALEVHRIAALPEFPGISTDERLPALQEQVVLQCVAELLIEHGVCFQHEGLLVFPSLFSATEHSQEDEGQHSVSLHYDFSGAIDNIYASLVAWLVIGQSFGRLRLWKDRAEFSEEGHGTCGVCRRKQEGGFAHIDIYFEDRVVRERRELFASFVEHHLRSHDIELIEHIDLKCQCGHRIEEPVVRERIASGRTDVGCPRCDKRLQLSEGIQIARDRDPGLEKRTLALRTRVEDEKQSRAESVKQHFALPAQKRFDTQVVSDSQEPHRILHLSDLHFDERVDPEAMLQPLVSDIRYEEGLSLGGPDYIVISGDVCNKATPQEFEVAYRFVSGLIGAFQLSAKRCIVVPGNHDLSWDEPVYDWMQARKANMRDTPSTSLVTQGDGYLIRNEEIYPNRFRNFSQDFHHPLLLEPYPLEYENQGTAHFFKESGLQFICLNSAWEIDEWNRERASVHPGALARVLQQADAQTQQYMNNGESLLRIGVWHHPVAGAGQITDTAFLEQLRKANVKLALSGHVHEERTELIGYLHKQQIHMAGAGSFGGATHQRPASTPCLYNLIEIARDHSWAKVHTRCRRKTDGAWEGLAVWPHDHDTRKTSYTIQLGGNLPVD